VIILKNILIIIYTHTHTDTYTDTDRKMILFWSFAYFASIIIHLFFIKWVNINFLYSNYWTLIFWVCLSWLPTIPFSLVKLIKNRHLIEFDKKKLIISTLCYNIENIVLWYLIQDFPLGLYILCRSSYNLFNPFIVKYYQKKKIHLIIYGSIISLMCSYIFLIIDFSLDNTYNTITNTITNNTITNNTITNNTITNNTFINNTIIYISENNEDSKNNVKVWSTILVLFSSLLTIVSGHLLEKYTNNLNNIENEDKNKVLDINLHLIFNLLNASQFIFFIVPSSYYFYNDGGFNMNSNIQGLLFLSGIMFVGYTYTRVKIIGCNSISGNLVLGGVDLMRRVVISILSFTILNELLSLYLIISYSFMFFSSILIFISIYLTYKKVKQNRIILDIEKIELIESSFYDGNDGNYSNNDNK
jgi:hypothetical protein